MLMFVFFFSSRRRHTRWPRDWSSDVCSSDLLQLQHIALPRDGDAEGPYVMVELHAGGDLWPSDAGAQTDDRQLAHEHIGQQRIRSEERRVGKEGRGRWGRE